MQDKINRLENALKEIDPNIVLSVEDRPDGKLVYGPFPTFLIHLTEVNDRFLIHVNADAPNMVYYMTAVMNAIPGIIHDGAFAVDAETSQLLLGADAYTKKDENILEFAQAIWEKRREEAAKKLYVPGDQKLVIAK